MVIEGVLEVIFPFIARVLGYIFVEVLFHVICYSTGFILIRLFTLGKRPKKFISPKSGEEQDTSLMLIGLLFWCVAGVWGMVFLCA